ncbi:MAG: hypothetical protein IJ298_06460 [Ruminococcus sp.]|nr:hypothetical protein [Ruminococcus sp.]
MRIIGAEFRKLFTSRLFVICLVLFLVINSVGFYFMSANDGAYEYELSISDEYKAELEKYLEMDTETAKAELILMQEAYQIASTLNSSSSSGMDAEYIETVIENYKAESPEAFVKAQEIISDGFSVEKLTAINLLANKFDYIEQYKVFVQEMQARADSQLKFSIFSKSGTFAYNNIAKTPSDFEELKDTEITPGFDLGLKFATTFELTDYLTLFLVVLVCITLFAMEREKGLTILVKSTPMGRTETLFAKLFVTAITVSGFAILYYVSILLTSEFAFGLGDLSRSIQSVPEYMNCNLKVSVFEYLCLWVVQKVLTLCAVSMVFALLFTLIKSTNITYIVLALFLGAEFACFNFIDALAPFNHLKYINVFYFLSGNGLFGSYLNLNFFTKPVNVLWTYLGFLLLCFCMCTVASALAFSKQNQFGVKNPFTKYADKIRGKIHIFSHNSTVFGGECFKHYISSKVVLVLLVLLLFAYGNFTDDISITYSSGADVAYAAYMNELQGEVTQEKEEFLQNEQSYFDSLYLEIETINSDTTLTDDEKSMKIMAVENILDTRGKGFEKVMLQYSTITFVGDELGITPHFINENIGTRLMANSAREWNYFALLLVLSVFTLSSVFAYEHKREMSKLISATQKGKGRLFFSKFSVATITYIVIYILLYLPYMVNFIKTFGTNIFSEPLVFLEGFAGLGNDMSIFSALILENIAHIFIGIAAVSFILLMSEKLKSTVTAMTVSTAVTLIPCLLIYFDSSLRIFALFQNGRLWMLTLIIIMSAIILVSLLIYNFITFTGISLRRFKYETGNK